MKNNYHSNTYRLELDLEVVNKLFGRLADGDEGLDGLARAFPTVCLLQSDGDVVGVHLDLQ